MELNKLTAEKDWVSKQNENIDKLSVKSERANSIVGVNGWSIGGSDNYVMTVPGLDNTMKILHVNIKKSGVTPGQGQHILKIPSEVGTGTPRGISMKININNSGHYGGYMDMYFADGTTLDGNLVALDGQTQAQNIDLSFSLMYW